MDWLWKRLGAIPPSEMTGLQLQLAGCWTIHAKKWDAELSLAALPIMLDEDCVLYLEGGSHSEEVRAFVDAHKIEPVLKIQPGTIWPRQSNFHLPATRPVFDGLSRLADHHAVPEICDHLVVYRPSVVVVDWYDAFDREIYASSTIPEHSVREFSETVGASYEVEK